jgi:pilus assembly protein FimV
MSRGPYPILLMLAMSLPGAVKALGLGDIRVDSALNEPLSAQIDIVGATREELVELTAKVANREMFQRYGADRPSFLATATFKVGLDSLGRPVLNVRSAEAFTDPVINFLVDLRWGKGELIREYSLLLDPAGFSSAPRVAVAAPVSDPARLPAVAPSTDAVSSPDVVASPTVVSSRAAASPLAASTTQVDSGRGSAPSSAPIASQHRVVARDTLRTIARRAGAVSESQAQRMMIAIFRANPHAFEGNINILHLGALLSIPSAQDVAAIDGADAKREVRAHMTAWRLDGRPAAQQRVAAVTPVSSAHGTVAAQATAEPAQPHAAAAAMDAAAQAADAAATAALKDRVQSLEKALEQVHQQLAAENAKIQDLKQTGAQEAVLAAEPKAADTAAAIEAATGSPVQVERMRAEERPAPVLAAMAPSPGQPATAVGLLSSIAVGLALLLGGFAYFRRRISLATAASPSPAEEPVHTPGIAHREATPQRPESAEAKAAPVSRVQERPTPLAADAIIAREIHPRTESDDIDENMGIDTVALEKSYIDSLGDTFGIDETAPHKAVEDTAETATHAMATAKTAAHDTAEMNTVALDVSELDTAIVKADLNTAILDTRKADPAAANNTVLDYNLLDLDATTQHVHMPSDLLDQPAVKDRRTNIVDVLKMAIERDPERRDLRMKLLETYFSAASTNQRGFLEVVRKLSREPNYLSADDWQKVVMMGRAIAPDDILFADQAKDDDLAHCA